MAKEIKAFWIQSSNVGDTLTPVIVEHFTGLKVIHAPETHEGKLIGIGSTMTAMREGDTVWGTGIMRETDLFPHVSTCNVLAVRGKLTEKTLGVNVGVYGDPALLLPLMYAPDCTKKHTMGIIPHYAEKGELAFTALAENNFFIDVNKKWDEFIDDIVSCEEIISSSLHAIIIAEAYGVHATWIKPTDKVAGNGFKFRDYLTGTGREEQGEGLFPPIPNIKEIQDGLINSLQCLKS